MNDNMSCEQNMQTQKTDIIYMFNVERIEITL